MKNLNKKIKQENLKAIPAILSKFIPKYFLNSKNRKISIESTGVKFFQSGGSFKDIFYINANDVHPPFYYCTLKLFVTILTKVLPLINTTILGKMFSFIPYILIIILINTKIRKKGR